MIALLLACTSPETVAPAEAPPWTAPDEWGPYEVGIQTREFTDARGKEMTVEVWYPAVVAEGTPADPYEPMALTLQAHREPEPDLRGAPYPLVAFSHGFGGVRFQSAFLMEQLASHGFVVVAPDHVDNTMFDLDEDAVIEVLLERPDDVRAAVDEVWAATDAPLSGLAAPGAYSIVGHSFGAYTALVVGGGEVDYPAYLAACEDGADLSLCGDWAGTDPAVLEGHGTGDDRVVSTVALAPGVWYAFSLDGSGLQSVRQPLVMGGDRDEDLDYDDEIRPCYENTLPPRRMATLKDAGHYAFTDICLLAPFITDECEEEAGGWLPLETSHRITNALVSAWLGVTLKGEERDRPWTEAGALSTEEALTFEVDDP